MRKFLLSMTLLLAFVGLGAADIMEGGPTSGTTEVQVELPPSMQLHNKAGNDGSGLCVFTSIEMAAEWANVDTLRGLRDWMTHQRGGGYPSKVDEIIKRYAQARSRPVPDYLQHTGGDLDVLKTALAAGRYPAVTYAGYDRVHYRGRISHMVNLAYLDDSKAAIQDNNFPGVWVWMSTAEFADRWRKGGGGWAVILLGDAPPPIPSNLKLFRRNSTPRPSESRDADDTTAPDGLHHPKYEWVQLDVDKAEGVQYLLLDGVRIGAWRPDRPAREGPMGEPLGIWMDYDAARRVWGPEQRRLPPTQPPEDDESINFGVQSRKIHAGAAYSLGGRTISKSQALAVLGASRIAQDAPRQHITAVGDPAYLTAFAASWSTLDASVRAGYVVQLYPPTSWAVTSVGLAPGVTLQSPEDARGVGTVLWRARGILTAAQLREALRRPNLLYAPDGDPVPPDGKPVEPPIVPEPLKPLPDPVAPAPLAPKGPSMLSSFLSQVPPETWYSLAGVLLTLLASYAHQSGTTLPILRSLLDPILNPSAPVVAVPATPASNPVLDAILKRLEALEAPKKA